MTTFFDEDFEVDGITYYRYEPGVGCAREMFSVLEDGMYVDRDGEARWPRPHGRHDLQLDYQPWEA